MIIKHKRAMDVCFRVDLCRKIKRWGVTGEWINMGFRNSYYIGVSESIIIDPADWETTDTPFATCLRYATWKQLV